MDKPEKGKRKRSAVKVTLVNDGTNTNLRSPEVAAKISKSEADLYKQSKNPLGDPNRK